MTTTPHTMLKHIEAHAPGEDFDIGGVTYRIVYLAPREQRGSTMPFVCERCPVVMACRPMQGCRADRAHYREHAARAVVPVADIPVLVMKGLLA